MLNVIDAKQYFTPIFLWHFVMTTPKIFRNNVVTYRYFNECNINLRKFRRVKRNARNIMHLDV